MAKSEIQAKKNTKMSSHKYYIICTLLWNIKHYIIYLPKMMTCIKLFKAPCVITLKCRKRDIVKTQ